MKRTFRIFLFAAILAAFLMAVRPYCRSPRAVRRPFPPSRPAPPATTAPTEEPAPTFDDSVLGEAYTNEGTFTDAWGSEWSYSLHLPCLLLDTPAAEELNSKIHRDLFGFVTAMETAIAQNTPASCAPSAGSGSGRTASFRWPSSSNTPRGPRTTTSTTSTVPTASSLFPAHMLRASASP